MDDEMRCSTMTKHQVCRKHLGKMSLVNIMKELGNPIRRGEQRPACVTNSPTIGCFHLFFVSHAMSLTRFSPSPHLELILLLVPQYKYSPLCFVLCQIVL